MSNPLSVLQRAKKSDLHTSPFPYIIIKDALPAALCEELIATYPPLATMGVDASKNNSRWSYPTRMGTSNPEIAQIWRDFVAYHASTAFFHEIVDLFYDSINELYPGRFASREAMKRLTVGIRGNDTKDDKEILMDAQISGNTRVTKAKSVRTTHIDSGDKLFSGLFYLRRDNDDSQGGDLVISKFKPRYATKFQKLSCFQGVYVDEQFVDEIDVVKYSKNVVIIFINSLDSLHGVTVRHPTPHERIFLNLVGEIREPLYQVPSRWKLLPLKLNRRIRDMVGVQGA